MDGKGAAYGLIDDGALGHALWLRALDGWHLIDTIGGVTEMGRSRSLVIDDAGCLHAALTIGAAAAHASRRDDWSFDVFGTPNEDAYPVLSLAASGQPHIAYWEGGPDGWSLRWAAPPSDPETVLPLNSDGLDWRTPISLTVATSDSASPGTPHILAPRFLPPGRELEVAYATREPAAGWLVRSVARGSSNDPFDLVPPCGSPRYDGEPCSYSYEAFRPLAVVASGGEVRVIYNRYLVQGDLRSLCRYFGEAPPYCQWQGPKSVDGTLEIAWPANDAFDHETVLEGVIAQDGTAVVDRHGVIHLAIEDRAAEGSIRYIAIGSPSQRPCVSDCNHDGVVTVDEVITSLVIALEIRSVDACPSSDVNRDSTVTIDEVIAATNSVLSGCGAEFAG